MWITITLVLVTLEICLGDDPIAAAGQDRDNFAARQYPETNDILSEYDFIIVGAGSAGCVLANRLSEIPKWKVLLIEAGGPEQRKDDVPAIAPRLQMTDVDWQFVSEPATLAGFGLINNSFAIPQGKVMGGSSTINAMIYTRGNPLDFDRWGTEWSYKKIEKYFHKLENYTIPAKGFGTKGPLHIENPPYRSKFSGSLLKATQQYGLKLTNLNGPEQIGVSRIQTTIQNGYRFSANSAYLVPIRRSNLHLKMNCTVKKVLLGQANSVMFTCPSESYVIRATKEVLISAGAINSPKLLMLSGIGPASHLKSIGIPVIKDLPVGKNLMDHINSVTQFTVNQTVLNTKDYGLFLTNNSGPLSLPAASEVYAYSHPKNQVPTIEQLFISSPFTPGIARAARVKPEIYQSVFATYANHPGYQVFSLLQKPKSRGFLQLRDNNPDSKPKIYPNYLSHPMDLDTIITGIKESIKISEQPALRNWGASLLPEKIPPCDKFEFKSDKYFKCLSRTITFSLYHHCGTCKMGLGKDSVVDMQLKVRGVRNLRVVDSSIIPEILSGHLNGPVMMIAEKAADMIKEEHGELRS